VYFGNSVFYGVLGVVIVTTTFASQVVKICWICVCVKNSVSEIRVTT